MPGQSIQKAFSWLLWSWAHLQTLPSTLYVRSLPCPTAQKLMQRTHGGLGEVTMPSGQDTPGSHSHIPSPCSIHSPWRLRPSVCCLRHNLVHSLPASFESNDPRSQFDLSALEVCSSLIPIHPSSFPCSLQTVIFLTAAYSTPSSQAFYLCGSALTASRAVSNYALLSVLLECKNVV